MRYIMFIVSTDPSHDIRSLEIQVNAVATVLKNFFNLTEPLIPFHLHDELLEAAGRSKVTRTTCRLWFILCLSGDCHFMFICTLYFIVFCL